MFAGNFAPRYWATCDGQILPLSQNTALFSLLGTNYGGNGTSNFALPNMQGRVPVHAGDGNSGPGPGLTQRVVGETGGAEILANAAVSVNPPAPITAMPFASNQDTRSPYLVLNFIIALQGIFPPR